ncbi:MAG: phosphoglucosamine mutase [Candidatus Marinimicrobia bacterium]|nr:phosphoglucosamine mutase [Candidatus Neomarinimicrobiota bacterium]
MLIRSISGVRGITDTHFTPSVIVNYARALHHYLPKGVIVCGRDSRPSGKELQEVMAGELVRLGRTIVDCGIVPTPTVQFMVNDSEAIGGYVITASHNPIDWNGLKFLRSDSTFFNSDDCKNIFELTDQNIDSILADEDGLVWHEKNSIQKHIISCASIGCIDLNRIQNRKFKIVIDAVNGAGSIAIPKLLETLGCDVIKLNCEPDGNFTRGTEPLPEHLTELGQIVAEKKADAGFAVDPDADRLAIINEKGEPIGEEYTLVIAADGYLKETKRRENFVVNLSTSLAIDKLADKNKCMVTRSAVGEINVVNKMNEVNSELGGEGNGGVILRECHLGRDSLVAATMVLNRMSLSDTPLSQIHDALPRFKIVKDKINVDVVDVDKVIKDVSSLFSDAVVDRIDGIKFIWDDRWVHLRKSNTEPIIRIYAEAPYHKEALELVDKIKTII